MKYDIVQQPRVRFSYVLATSEGCFIRVRFMVEIKTELILDLLTVTLFRSAWAVTIYRLIK